MNTNLPNWPPTDEPVTPGTVITRLDQVGWTVDAYRLLDYTARHALVRYPAVFEPHVVIVDLRDGHTVATYETPQGAFNAFRVLSHGGEPEDED